MHVFICWSGTRSLSAAKALKRFFEELNQAPGLPEDNRLTAFYSRDIEKGSEWFKAVQSELSKADAAVIVITPENARSHWMHFEAGAVVSQILARDNAAY